MKFKPGVWSMRNGLTAHVMYEIPEPHGHEYILHGYYTDRDGINFSESWSSDGRTCSNSECGYDLVPSIWYGIKADNGEIVSVYRSKKEALKVASEKYIVELIEK